jgi:tetratricopeptide (TPR) repeat protein
MVRGHYADLLSLTGHHEEAIGEVLRAMSLDPLKLFVNVDVGERILQAGRQGEAVGELQRAITTEPNHYYTHVLSGWAYRREGLLDEAAGELEKAPELSRRAPIVVFDPVNLYWETDQRS